MRPMLRLVSVAAVLATLLAVGGGAAATAQEASPAAATPCPATSEDENAALVRRWFEEALNRGNTDVVDELLAPDYLHHQATGPDHVGPAGNKRWLRAFRTGFPDARFTLDRVVRDGDLVAVRWTATGTHLGKFERLAPTGRRATWTEINLSRIACGRIAEGWSEADGVGIMQQLGALPAISTPAAGTPAA